MRRVFAIAVLACLFAVPALASRHSAALRMPDTVRVGDKKIPLGDYEVSWSDSSEAEVQVTFKQEGKKAIVVPARVVQESHDKAGSLTFEVKGVSYLKQVNTNEATLVFQDPTDIK
jgi:hypothetical protein